MPEFTLKELASKVKGHIVGDSATRIHGAAKIDSAAEGELTFLANPKYKPFLDQTRASAVIIDQKMEYDLPLPAIRVDDVYFRFLQIFLIFNPPKEILEPGIHPTAVIHPSAELGKKVAIGAHVTIGENCRIGDGTRILHGCVIMNNVEIGKNGLLYPLVSIRENCQIGDRVILHNGAVIGSDGFGFAPYEGTFHKIPQIGRVLIEDEVEIGANCTIDRATMGETVIKKGVKLDNLVHIAHNVEVGEWTVMAAQSGISGSTKIGHHVMVGGQVGMVGHITIGNYVQIGAQSGVPKNVPDKEIIFGYPARPIMRTKRIEAVINQLPELLKRIQKLEKEIEQLK
ncbi:MAG: UDP-3-O-(3-hydroxymyristoyl)glucosamine N-acyltransferase [bacterium]|nr:MAG: UDP-3-O-(3-hydroxymyristoyl)glucosamine N-acyltransferase [bacterium]